MVLIKREDVRDTKAQATEGAAEADTQIPVGNRQVMF